jgi:3-methyladenine DNA glycosylase/8-oxoguanine DNA glycosylase
MGADRAGPLASRNWRRASRFSGASQGWAIGTPARRFPARGFPEDLKALEPDDLKHHGFSSTKARTIIATAQAVVTGRLDLEAPQRLEDGAPIERLSSLRGIGRWTAEHVLRRGLGPPARTFFPATTSARTTSSGTCSGSTRPLDHEGVHRLWHAGIHTQALSTSTCS